MAALTAAQKAQIRLYLGYPSLFRYKDTRLESTFDALDQEAIDLIATNLAAIQVVETAIVGVEINKAGLKRADDIEFYNGKSMSEIKSYGRMYVSRVSIVLGVPIYSDVFGTQGYLGDKYTGILGMPSGAAGRIKLG